jgi:hypothetical protein
MIYWAQPKTIYDMKIRILIVLTFLLAPGKFLTAQSIEGTWKGTSLCQVKNSPCHDEQVIYHITKDSSGNSYKVIANKIIAGKEDYMGTLTFTFVQEGILVSIDSVRNARWEFKLTGKKIKGTLVYKNELYRIIDVNKEN